MKQPLLALTGDIVNITVQIDSQGQKSHQCLLVLFQDFTHWLNPSSVHPHISIFLEQHPLGNTSCMRENEVFNTSSTRSGYVTTGIPEMILSLPTESTVPIDTV